MSQLLTSHMTMESAHYNNSSADVNQKPSRTLLVAK